MKPTCLLSLFLLGPTVATAQEAPALVGPMIPELLLKHEGLTYDGSQAIGAWARSPVPAGRQLPKPKPLFKRLEPSVALDELARLSQEPEEAAEDQT